MRPVRVAIQFSYVVQLFRASLCARSPHRRESTLRAANRSTYSISYVQVPRMPINPNKTDYSRSFPPISSPFPPSPDPRDGGHIFHYFGEIFFIASARLLCGVRSHDLVEECTNLRENRLRKSLHLPPTVSLLATAFHTSFKPSNPPFS
jgi:hypothetical protein